MTFEELQNLLKNPNDPKQYLEGERSKLVTICSLLSKGKVFLAKLVSWFSPFRVQEVVFNGETFYVVVESTITGSGSYIFRLEGDKFLQAPHSFFDLKTGEISLQTFLKNSSFRVFAINNVHRYFQPGGEIFKNESPEENKADAAHNPFHPISQVTSAILEDSDLSVFQIHGFSKEPSDPDVIVSSGEMNPSVLSNSVTSFLKNALQGYSVKHFNVGVSKLGALTNVQGSICRQKGREFVHLELSRNLREDLLCDHSLHDSFSSFE